MSRYCVYDVFTDRRFGGNQLAVFPEAEGLAEADLQSIAREFNFSETVFVYPPEDPSRTAKLRIFTPGSEVPFAGHPTIGTAVALAHEGHGPELALELGVGPISARAEGDRAEFTTTATLETPHRPEAALVARALGLDQDRLAGAPVMASLGLPFTFVQLAARADLAACVPDMAAIREGAARYPGGLDFALFAWVREGDMIDARMFAPLDGVPEDPATGSAAATLGALLAKARGVDVALQIRQGDDMGRPSRIGIRTSGASVTVSGQAVRVMDGRLL